MSNKTQQFVRRASKEYPHAAVYDPIDPPASWIPAVSGYHINFVPKNTVHRLTDPLSGEYENPHMEYAHICEMTLINAIDFVKRWEEGELDNKCPDNAPEIPDTPINARYITGTMSLFQSRFVRGALAEIVAGNILASRGEEILRPEEHKKYKRFSDPTQKMENDGVDIITDLFMYHVKTYLPHDLDESNADRLLVIQDKKIKQERVL